MEPSSSGASLEVRKIAVGPSAPPMMAMEAACFSENPSPSPSALIAHAPRCGSAEQEALRVCNQRAEVGHSADAEEDDRRIDTELNAEVEHIQQTALVKHLAIVKADFLSVGYQKVRALLNVFRSKIGGWKDSTAQRDKVR